MGHAERIANALRAIAPQGKLKSEDIPPLNVLAQNWSKRDAVTPPAANDQLEPPWTKALLTKLGEKEVPGPKHNLWISVGWAALGAGWFNDDETPWCGFAVAWALQQAGIPYPKNFPSAASFKSWGRDTAARVGAIGVKARPGGNHVFIIVGETEDKVYYKALGGNQSNEVNIVDIRKTEVDAIRWPTEVPLPPTIYLPIMRKGKLVGSMA